MTGRGAGGGDLKMAMPFTRHEINLIRQWFNAVEDLDRKYLADEDYSLADRICDVIGADRPRRKAPRDGAGE